MLAFIKFVAGLFIFLALLGACAPLAWLLLGGYVLYRLFRKRPSAPGVRASCIIVTDGQCNVIASPDDDHDAVGPHPSSRRNLYLGRNVDRVAEQIVAKCGVDFARRLSDALRTA